ncbi:MAG: DUF1669 domain-containing protein, partial [Candidatus Sericytochromatia bacterium]|nr:DUF1669 domain-containing protein [Candidatus Sericytochromatia bacterium]
MIKLNQSFSVLQVSLLSAFVLSSISCSSNSIYDNQSNNQINSSASIYSSNASIERANGIVEGDERGNEPKSRRNTNKLKLSGIRSLPALPIYAAFNNDYKGLFADNEPIAHADANNPDKFLYSLIASAKTSIDAAIFDIDDPDATNAFIEAKKRGVTIRIVTDGDNLKDKTDPTKQRAATESLKSAGIPVHDDGNRGAFMHDKFIIVDNKWVWTGSYNLTTNAMFRDNNNVVMVNSPELAQNFNAEFKRLFEQGLFVANPHEIPNPLVTLNDKTTIKTFFSPGGGTKEAITAELQKSTKSIKFMAFSFTDTDMAAILEQKKNTPGFQVEGILDSCLISQYSIYNSLKQNKIFVKGDGNQALMHHKTMIIDDSIVITGSFNFSKNA